ncbi:MAG: galactokinase [Verrucomicrobiae bacterium]|nr:galactokinase [Verrucomicrobiae bacterium]
MIRPIQQRVTEIFRQRYGGAPSALVRAPGRVNLIGEHTDYNDGFVLPMAIDRASWIALRPRDDGKVRLYSVQHDQTVEFALDAFRRSVRHWGEYPKGVAWALQQAGYRLNGWEGVTDCDVPLGAGLSSSASFEMATVRAFEVVSGFAWEPAKLALLGQRAENEWVGVNCGVMDQMISAAGKAGHALLIDCRTLQHRLVPLPPKTVVVILDTATRRGLVGSAYNERRAQCEAAARFFGVRALRDVSVAEFLARANELDEVTRRRARHVVTENERTLQAAEAMCRGDARLFGQLMNESHESLRSDFEVTNDALNVMVECARRANGCFGARMTGAGFGGCAVALVEETVAEDFVRTVAARYQRATGLIPQLYVTVASDGAEIIR